MDLIGRSIAAAVSHNLAGPMLRRSRLHQGDSDCSSYVSPAAQSHMFAAATFPRSLRSLAEKYGPVFAAPSTVCGTHDFHLAGPADKPLGASARAHVPESQRLFCQDFEKVYGASGLHTCPGWRRSFPSSQGHGAGVFTRETGRSVRTQVYHQARTHLWRIGRLVTPSLQCDMCRRMINDDRISPHLAVSIDSQDIIDRSHPDTRNERSCTLTSLKDPAQIYAENPGDETPGETRQPRVDEPGPEVAIHAAQRAGCPRDLADDLLSLHASDPRILPESNLAFRSFGAAACQPVPAAICVQLRFVRHGITTGALRSAESKVKPMPCLTTATRTGEALTPAEIDVTHRFLIECLRHVPDRPDVYTKRDEFVCGRGLRTTGGSHRSSLPRRPPHYMNDVFPNPFLIRY